MIKPNALTAKDWYDLGLERKRDGDFTGALDAFRDSIKLNPNVAAPWIYLAKLLDSNNQLEEARQCFMRAVMADAKNLMARQMLASSHQKLGYVDAAKQEYENAIKLDPNAELSYLGLGQLFEDLGEPEQAAKAYRHAIKLAPDEHEALANLLGLSRHVDISAEIAQAETLLKDLPFREKALVGYGLGKAYQQQKQYDAAFNAYATANAARRETSEPFNRKALDARIDNMIALFSSEFFDERKTWGDPSERPIFIVGLPRSGTTLTEQILASHSACFGAGELAVLADLATGTPDRLHDESTYWPYCAPRLTHEHMASIAQDYHDASGQRAFDAAKRVVDKQPLNFWHLGLIAMALPNARIIHCVRDIRDCGFSIFTQNFNLQQNWSTDLSDIAHYWQGYRKLMAHWQKVSGLQILEVAYEDTVSDLELQAKRLLDFVDLPWQDNVLNFHETERAVQTPSKWQVRQPLYQSSKARWRQYENHLAPLIEAAEPSQ